MPSELLDLDERFGICIDPTRVYVHDCERGNTQQSLFRLDDDGAARLRRIIEAVETAFYLSHCIISEFFLLWVIEKDGCVVVALEEGMNEVGDRKFPLPRGLVRPREARKLKLGHRKRIWQHRLTGSFSLDCCFGKARRPKRRTCSSMR
jgi:hypothetical protein